MDFGQFINAFGTGYRHLEETRNPETGRINHLKKQHFCRMLLCAITKNETYVSNRSDVEFQSFYRNKDRRSLHPIAEEIFDKNDLDTEKFKHFLKRYYAVCSKDKLYLSFKELNPTISLEMLEDDITDEFVSILQEAAAKPDGRRKPPKTDQTAANKEAVVEELIEKMKRIFNGLIKTGRKIANNQRAFGSFKYPLKPTPELWDQLQRQFDKLTELNSTLLKQDSDKHPTVQDLISTVEILKADDFVLSDFEYCILIPGKEQPVHNVKNLLAKLESEFPTQPDTEQETPAP